ncbi:protein translocase subunit SecF [bacterium]|nr:protein translocase subunit SecF [candidate division CSSED10-310 bacterium]
MELFKNTKFDFVGRRRIAMAVSTLVIVAGIISLIIQGGPNYGIDFTGGLLVQVKFDQAIKVEPIRDAMREINLGQSIIQHFGERDEVLIRVVAKGSDTDESVVAKQIETTLKEKFGENSVEIRRIEMVGPRIGEELRTSALLAIGGAIVGILIYIAFRFDLLFGIAAIIALIHDVLVTIGLLSITHKEVDLTVVAAVLTIVGYSLNDTIVVFDRIRENLRLVRKQGYPTLINDSLNQTLNRTLLTSLTTLLVVACLFLFGGEVIHNFSFALLVGVVVGTYSSIFVASPILVEWHSFRNKAKGSHSAKAGKVVRQDTKKRG